MFIMYDGDDLVRERVTSVLTRTLDLSYFGHVSLGTSISIHLIATLEIIFWICSSDRGETDIPTRPHTSHAQLSKPNEKQR